MKIFKFPIAIGLSPNTENEDVSQAIKILFQPNLWRKGQAQKDITEWFNNYFSTTCAYSFNSGRSAFYSLLRAFEIGTGDEIIIQPFTCVAVVDPIIWTGAKPVYADIDKSVNIDYLQLEKVISRKTRAIIVQHTFGIPAVIDRIAAICAKYKILLIEDCAHSLGAQYKDKLLGTFGDASFFSFGRDKIISSVFGGMAIINCQDQKAKSKLENIHAKSTDPSSKWILLQLLHPVLFAIILPLYDLFIGKVILAVCLKLNIINKPVTEMEKNGLKPSNFPEKYPNALATLLLLQLKKLEKYNIKRRENAGYYYTHLCGIKDIVLPEKINGAIYLRFNILSAKADLLLRSAKKRHMILGNWYRNLIDPPPVDYQIMNYQQNSCPIAQKIARMSVNLPTYPRINNHDLAMICCLIKSVCI